MPGSAEPPANEAILEEATLCKECGRSTRRKHRFCDQKRIEFRDVVHGEHGAAGTWDLVESAPIGPSNDDQNRFARKEGDPPGGRPTRHGIPTQDWPGRTDSGRSSLTLGVVHCSATS
jgi:hypothetical protein